MSGQEIKFTTEVDYQGRRERVEVEAYFSPGYREQEYPGAHVWHHKSSVDIEIVRPVGNPNVDITAALSEASLKALERGAYDALAGDEPRTEFDEEDRVESLEAQRFEDMAYGRDD